MPETFYIAHLPDAYGYGITGYGKTAKEAEAACRKEYRANNQGPNTGWHAQPWPVAKDHWGFSITIATTGKAHLDGCGDYVGEPE